MYVNSCKMIKRRRGEKKVDNGQIVWVTSEKPGKLPHSSGVTLPTPMPVSDWLLQTGFPDLAIAALPTEIARFDWLVG